MSKGGIMLRVGLLAVSLWAVPQHSGAQETLDRCALMGEIGELIMQFRQNGAEMKDLVQIERLYPPSLRGMVEVASELAVLEPRYETGEEQQAAILRVRDGMLRLCRREQ
ncbi:hypothetical protein [Devosia sp.]|uniref:hypothetical protein n=1 Tax=Devosia sp. TaxID=1871048 RepID=UPI0035B11334